MKRPTRNDNKYWKRDMSKFNHKLYIYDMELYLTTLEQQVKNLNILAVVKVESNGTSVFCPECGGELLYVEHDKCTTEGCKNCIF